MENGSLFTIVFQDGFKLNAEGCCLSCAKAAAINERRIRYGATKQSQFLIDEKPTLEATAGGRKTVGLTDIRIQESPHGGFGVRLFDGGGAPEEAYIADDVGSTLLLVASLLKGLDPPRYYNGRG